MGLLNDIFGTPKPRVNAKEYKKAKLELYNEGFTKRERAKVDDIFAPDYNMPGTETHPRGLEKNEIDARIKWMRENKSKHGLSEQEINEVEASFKKRL
jgi:hypothetical protein